MSWAIIYVPRRDATPILSLPYSDIVAALRTPVAARDRSTGITAPASPASFAAGRVAHKLHQGVHALVNAAARSTATLAKPLGMALTSISMGEVVKLPRAGEDTIWAVMASLGRTERIAEIYPTRIAALADRAWREQQVRAYAALLRSTKQGIPRYSVAPIRRADLPRPWTPLPALGFLRGTFV